MKNILSPVSLVVCALFAPNTASLREPHALSALATWSRLRKVNGGPCGARVESDSIRSDRVFAIDSLMRAYPHDITRINVRLLGKVESVAVHHWLIA